MMQAFGRFTSFAWLLCVGCALSADDDRLERILVLGAVPQEITMIVEALEGAASSELSGVAYHKGSINDIEVIVALTGVGKTYTGMVTTLFLREFDPDMAFMTGTAARINPRLSTGDVILAEAVFFHDYGSMTEADIAWHYHDPSGVKANEPYTSHPALAEMQRAASLLAEYEPHTVVVDGQERTVSLQQGTVTSGDLFGVNARRIEKLRGADVDLMEMESAGFAQICEHFKVPYLIIRSGSNQAQPTPNDDYKIYGPIAAKSAATVTLYLIRNWEP
ncbi:MAG: 5'-methylthioadenosine/S-adenosylhomocysteine nucleosidase [Opitutales bacterium]